MMKNQINLNWRLNKMNKTKILVLTLLLLCLLSLTSCRHIEDTNGPDDYSLNQITDEKIITGTTYSMFGSFETRLNNEYSLKVKKFSGVYLLEEISTYNYFRINLNLTINSGNAKVVIIKNNEIVYEFKVGEDDTYNTAAPGDYLLKIAGESANFSVKFTILTN